MTSGLELGADRRTVLKWLLGGAGAVVAGAAMTVDIAAQDDDDDDIIPPADDDDDIIPPADDDDDITPPADDDDDDITPPADDDDDDTDPPADDDDDDGGHPGKKPWKHHKHGKTSGGAAVESLPNTGTGSTSSSNGMLGVATVGAAAAYFAGKYLRQTASESAE
ncbi:MAG: LPXTG cell wall anchor domain-containing protein [Thermomicrobiales bacterium]|nr:LPXTG cell wall anchor domain-containing protein [Thermomicrobiales bacterium]